MTDGRKRYVWNEASKAMAPMGLRETALRVAGMNHQETLRLATAPRSQSNTTLLLRTIAGWRHESPAAFRDLMAVLKGES
jgi:hypothetical protein